MGQDFWAGPGNSRARWVVMLSVDAFCGFKVSQRWLKHQRVAPQSSPCFSSGLKNVKMSPFGQKAALPSKDPLSTSWYSRISTGWAKTKVVLYPHSFWQPGNGEKPGSEVLSGPLCLKTSSHLLHEHTWSAGVEFLQSFMAWCVMDWVETKDALPPSLGTTIKTTPVPSSAAGGGQKPAPFPHELWGQDFQGADKSDTLQ